MSRRWSGGGRGAAGEQAGCARIGTRSARSRLPPGRDCRTPTDVTSGTPRPRRPAPESRRLRAQGSQTRSRPLGQARTLLGRRPIPLGFGLARHRKTREARGRAIPAPLGMTRHQLRHAEVEVRLPDSGKSLTTVERGAQWRPRSRRTDRAPAPRPGRRRPGSLSRHCAARQARTTARAPEPA